VSYRIVIPARLASERLPRKPLLDIGGRSLIEHVYRCALRSAAESVVIATDSEEIRVAASAFGATVVMTSADHASGSDRIAECADLRQWADDVLVVNLQGDEPLMPPACLDQVAGLLGDCPQAQVASLYAPIAERREVEDGNVVKVVVDAADRAMYFSRSVIPYPRLEGGLETALSSGLRWKRHIGLYAYRAGALRAFTRTPVSPMETVEKLEQLRFIENGHRIVMAQACEHIPPGVDTPADLERVRTVLAAGN
jgi:3-deoxy-manno-octulosonate cytidylyltransferase (CMP-KDO synthetase)